MTHRQLVADISFTRFSFIVLVLTLGFTEQDYSVMEEGGEVTVCLVMNIAVPRVTREELNLTLGTQDGPIAIGEMCLPTILTTLYRLQISHS